MSSTIQICRILPYFFCFFGLIPVFGYNSREGTKTEVKVSEPIITKYVPARMIVFDGKPTASILLRKDYKDREKQGAKELQDYIEKSTGAKIPVVEDPENASGHVIRILVKELEEDESSEAFSIKVSSNRTDIVGNSPLGALYGVYDLLEEGIGVRWYLPGPLGEVVPENETLILPSLNYQESPSFRMRWVGEDKWMIRNKQNRCEDGFYIFPRIYHAQRELLPHDKYYKEHSDYFALIEGKRSNKHNAKLCYSNPEVAKEIVENMSTSLDSIPGIDLISFSPTDGALWCQCDSCRAMDEEGVPKCRSKSRRNLIFYNRLASELRKSHPEAQMLVGAYNVYNWPPKDPNIHADPMVSVIITHYEQFCMAHPVTDPTCPLNRMYLKLIKEWEELVGNDIYFYEYYWKVNWLDLPWPIVHSIKEDIPWYKKQGYQGLYTQYTLENIWTLYPNYYVAARLLWDSNVNVDSLVDKMYEDLFKKAAPWIKKYYSLMEKQTAECGEHFPGHGIAYNPQGRGYGPVVFNKEVRKKLREYYRKAVEENEDQTVARRLERIGTSLEWVERLMHYTDLKEKAKKEIDPGEAYAIVNQALGIVEALLNEVRRDHTKWNGVIHTEKQGNRLYKSVNRWQDFIAQLKP